MFVSKRSIFLISIVLVAVALSAVVLYNTNSKKNSISATAGEESDKAEVTDKKNTTEDSFALSDVGVSESDKSDVERSSTTSDETGVKTEELNSILVQGNSALYDLELVLKQDTDVENKSSRYISASWYSEGQSIEIELGRSMLDEKNIEKAWLNAVNAKTYMLTYEPSAGRERAYTLFSLDLSSKQPELKKIVYTSAQEVSDISITKDGKYLAFYITNTASYDRTLLFVIECDSDKPVIQMSQLSDGKSFGDGHEKGRIYNYMIISWITQSEIKLIESSYRWNEKSLSVEDKKQEEVIYNVLTNKIKRTEYEEDPIIDAVKRLYEFFDKKEYNKAYELLDDKFTLNAFKIFGATQLNKADIDFAQFADFAELSGVFNSLKIENIIKSEEDRDDATTARVYYYQSIIMNEGAEPVIMPLVATLKKHGNTWKVTALDDGKLYEPPFKN